MHACQPLITVQDSFKEYPNWLTVCQHKIEECGCPNFKRSTMILLSDVYLEEHTIQALLDMGKEVLVTYCALPEGRHKGLGATVVRRDGRLKVTTDSADKQYDDPDPEEFNLESTVVINTGVYKTRLFSNKGPQHIEDPNAPTNAWTHEVIAGNHYFQPTSLVEHMGAKMMSLDVGLHDKVIPGVANDPKLGKLYLDDIRDACILAHASRARRTAREIGTLSELIRAGHTAKSIFRDSHWKQCLTSLLAFNPEDPILREVIDQLMKFATSWGTWASKYAHSVAASVASWIDWIASKLPERTPWRASLRTALRHISKFLKRLFVEEQQVGDVQRFECETRPDLLNYIPPADTHSDVRIIDTPLSIGTVVANVPAPCSVDRADKATFEHTLKTRLEVTSAEISATPPQLEVLRQNLGGVLDEISQNQMIEPMDFRLGSPASPRRGGLNTPPLSPTSMTTPHPAKELYHLNSSGTCPDSLRQNFQSQPKLSISLGTETSITNACSDPWWLPGKLLLVIKMECLKRYLGHLWTLGRLSMTSPRSPAKQSTKLTTLLSMLTKVQKFLGSIWMNCSSEAIQAQCCGRTRLRKRTWRQCGSTGMDVDMPPVAADVAGTWTPPSETPCCQKHWCEQSLSCQVSKPSNCAREMITSSSKPAGEPSMCPSSRGLGSMSNVLSGQMYFRPSFVLDIYCRYKFGAKCDTVMSECLGKSSDILRGLLAILGIEAQYDVSKRKLTWSCLPTLASRLWALCVANGSGIQDSPISPFDVIDTTNIKSGTIAELQTKLLPFTPRLDSFMPAVMASRLRYRWTQNDISIVCGPVNLLTIQFSAN